MLPQFVARNTMLVAAVQDPSLRVLAAGRAGAGGLHVAAAERSLVELDRVPGP
ncbi:hypothetical protein ACGFIR_24870 [Micromonospora sp. NPDC049051]|uniref:hypothetical protein n=1 Tax=Micromonospora sp. NPDC049051 TaxID=3364264 RepID=UPI003721D14C